MPSYGTVGGGAVRREARQDFDLRTVVCARSLCLGLTLQGRARLLATSIYVCAMLQGTSACGV
jgi:hypothetical protein